MALYYTANGIVKDAQLHLGDAQGFHKMKDSAEAVVSLQADGDELEAIRTQFSNLRMHNGRVIEWFGDDAVFIARHLK